NLAQKILDASWGEFVRMLSYKAEGAGRIVVKVNPRGTSKGLDYSNPLRDYISACRILMRGRDYPDSLLERRPLLRTISYKEVVSGQVFSMKQEAPCVSEG
ncbi:MAG: transposase, partial [Candidatus Methanomethylicota archaeon]